MAGKLQVEPSPLDGVLCITPPAIVEDWRGENVEMYNRELYLAAGIGTVFVQDNISVSSRHVLRGLHGDQHTWKLVSCLLGVIYLVVVNCDPTATQYRKWTAFTLSSRSRRQVLIPPKFANGHVVLSDEAVFHYKLSAYYDRNSQFTIMWNDPDLAIWWPVATPLVSRRDAGAGESCTEARDDSR